MICFQTGRFHFNRPVIDGYGVQLYRFIGCVFYNADRRYQKVSEGIAVVTEFPRIVQKEARSLEVYVASLKLRPRFCIVTYRPFRAIVNVGITEEWARHTL